MTRYAIVRKDEAKRLQTTEGSWMWFVVVMIPMWMSDGGNHRPQPGTMFYAAKADATRDAKQLRATVVEWVTP